MEDKNTNTTETAPAAIAQIDPQSVDPVTTVTAADAITTDSENVVVANLHGKFRRFARLEHVPAGSRTYSSKAELRGQTKKQLETVYGFVKGCEPKSFKDHDTAVDNVWLAFSQLPIFDPVTDAPEAGEKASAAKGKGKKDAPSNGTTPDSDDKKKSYQKKREESKYVIKASTDKSAKMVSELAPQAQAVVEIIRKDGKDEYVEADLRALMEANKDKLRTRQTAWRIFQYYRSNLISADVLVQQ